MVLRAVSGAGGSGGSVAFIDITGDPTDNAALVAWGATLGGTALPPVLLSGTGPHALTHDDHTGRDVWINEATQSTLTFAITATSGALEGDLITVYNHGAGNLFATGTIYAPPGFKLWARKGEAIIARYSAVASTYESMTPEQKIVPGTEIFFSLSSIATSATISAHGIGAMGILDSSVATLRTPSAADSFSHRQRVAAVGPANAVSRSAGWAVSPTTSPFLAPTIAIPYGWKLTMCAGNGDVGVQGFFAMVLQSSVAGTGEPEASTNVIGFMAASSNGVGGADTNMCWGTTTGTTDATLITLNGGTGFPINSGSLGPMYEGTIEFRSDGATRWVIYTLRNLATGLAVSDVVTTNLPTEGVALGMTMFRGTGGGSQTGAAAPILEFAWAGAGALA